MPYARGNLLKNILGKRELFFNYFVKKKINYVVEPQWSIWDDGMNIVKNLGFVSSRITTTIWGIRDSLIHYGSINKFIKSGRIRLPHRSNNLIVTCFHISPNDSRIKLIPKSVKHVNLWHTSCRITKDKLVSLGVPEDKIVVIPLGVDLNHFNQPAPETKQKIRAALSIPKDSFVIGSFQKDGNGWGFGLEPKLIKGPDIFCDVVKELSKKFKIFVLLTGPARGYVKSRLERMGVSYLHHFLENPYDVAKYFKAIDLYLVTSRVEGGPKAVLECMASGVPLITTKVGFAPEIVNNAENGFLCNVGDTDGIVKAAEMLIEDKGLRELIVSNGLVTARQYGWPAIAKIYYEKLYRPLFEAYNI